MYLNKIWVLLWVQLTKDTERIMPMGVGAFPNETQCPFRGNINATDADPDGEHHRHHHRHTLRHQYSVRQRHGHRDADGHRQRDAERHADPHRNKGQGGPSGQRAGTEPFVVGDA